MQCVSRIKQQLGNDKPPHFCQLLVQSEPNAAGTAALAPSVVPDQTLADDLELCLLPDADLALIFAVSCARSSQHPGSPRQLS